MKIINELLVSDIQKSMEFYQEFFDFEVCELEGNPVYWARLKNGSTEIMLEDYKTAVCAFVSFPSKVGSSNIIKFVYEDEEVFQKVIQKIEGRNVKLLMELKQTDYGTKELAILDCDENIIIIAYKKSDF